MTSRLNDFSERSSLWFLIVWLVIDLRSISHAERPVNLTKQKWLRSPRVLAHLAWVLVLLRLYGLETCPVTYELQTFELNQRDYEILGYLRTSRAYLCSGGPSGLGTRPVPYEPYASKTIKAK